MRHNFLPRLNYIDNTALNPGTGGNVIATDDIGGVHYQRVKIGYGADGVYIEVDPNNPLPADVNARKRNTYIIPINRLINTALAANTTRQQVSIEHAANSTKTLRIRKIHLGALNTTAVAGDLRVFIDYGTAASTAPASGITVPPAVGGTTAMEAVVKTLPTITAATTKFVAFVGSAPATANSAIVGVTVYDWTDSDVQPLTLRAGNLESLVIGIQSFAANIFHVTGYIIVTEE